jgi:FKBP-type peptidyl-prolyl cis-trans isomerase FklB
MHRRHILSASIGTALAFLGVVGANQSLAGTSPRRRRPKTKAKTKAKAKAITMTTPTVSSDPVENLKIATDFLATNKNAPGVVTTPSGLQYVVTRAGPTNGAMPTLSSLVEVNYEGKLLNGQVFDSSYARGAAAQFPVNALIPGWVEVLQLMRPGDEWTIWIPPGLAYGERSVGRIILPNSLLIFRMKLEDIAG